MISIISSLVSPVLANNASLALLPIAETWRVSKTCLPSGKCLPPVEGRQLFYFFDVMGFFSPTNNGAFSIISSTICMSTGLIITRFPCTANFCVPN